MRRIKRGGGRGGEPVLCPLAVCLDIVEKYIIRSPTFGEYKDAGGYPCIGLKYAARQRDHALQLILIDKHFSKCDMCHRRPKQDTIRYDRSGAPAIAEHS